MGQRGAPDAAIETSPARRADGGRRDRDPTSLSQAGDELVILHDGQIAEPAELVKDGSPQKESLIAVRQV